MLRTRDPRFADITPADMQAMNWFVEKEVEAEVCANWGEK
jgi:hypothetical protein